MLIEGHGSKIVGKPKTYCKIEVWVKSQYVIQGEISMDFYCNSIKAVFLTHQSSGGE